MTYCVFRNNIESLFLNNSKPITPTYSVRGSNFYCRELNEMNFTQGQGLFWVNFKASSCLCFYWGNGWKFCGFCDFRGTTRDSHLRLIQCYGECYIEKFTPVSRISQLWFKSYKPHNPLGMLPPTLDTLEGCKT